MNKRKRVKERERNISLERVKERERKISLLSEVFIIKIKTLEREKEREIKKKREKENFHRGK